MKVIAHYSGFKIVDVPDNFSEDEIMDYLYGLDVKYDEVDEVGYKVLED